MVGEESEEEVRSSLMTLRVRFEILTNKRDSRWFGIWVELVFFFLTWEKQAEIDWWENN